MGCKLLAALSAFSVVSAFAAPTMYEAEDLPGASVAEGAEFSGGKYAKTECFEKRIATPV